MPTLLMTLFSLFCMSRRRLYQLSDSEVTSPAKGKTGDEGSGLTPGHPSSSQQAGIDWLPGLELCWKLVPGRAGTRKDFQSKPEHFPLLEAIQREKQVSEGGYGTECHLTGEQRRMET